MTKKHTNFILALDNSYFDRICYVDTSPVFNQGLVNYSTKEWCNEVQSNLVIRERHMLERETNYRQILPYIIIRQTNEEGVTKYCTYRRTSGVGESRLAGNVSIGYGGHIDFADIHSYESIIQLEKTIFQAAQRELLEEVKIFNISNDIELTFSNKFIHDNSNEVGKVHIGVVIEIDLPAGATLVSNEDHLTAMPSMTANQLLSSDLPLENWTRIYLEDVVSKTAETTCTLMTTDASVIVTDNLLPNDHLTSTIFSTSYQGIPQGSILTVTNKGEYQWAANAEERIENDDYIGFESMQSILRELWKTNKPLCQPL